MKFFIKNVNAVYMTHLQIFTVCFDTSPPQNTEMETPKQNFIHFIIYSLLSNWRKGKGIPMLYFKTWAPKDAYAQIQDTV